MCSDGTKIREHRVDLTPVERIKHKVGRLEQRSLDRRKYDNGLNRQVSYIDLYGGRI